MMIFNGKIENIIGLRVNHSSIVIIREIYEQFQWVVGLFIWYCFKFVGSFVG